MFSILQTCCRLNDSTYEKLRGTNLTAMLSFYTALQQCLDKGATIEVYDNVYTTHYNNYRYYAKQEIRVDGFSYMSLSIIRLYSNYFIIGLL